MPCREEARDRLRRDRFDLVAQSGQRAAPEDPQDLGVAVLATLLRPSKLSRKDIATRREASQRRFDCD